MKLRANNKGLTVKVNFWPADKCKDAYAARKSIRGQVVRPGKLRKLFSNADQLVKILGDWNVEQFQELAKKRAASVSN